MAPEPITTCDCVANARSLSRFVWNEILGRVFKDVRIVPGLAIGIEIFKLELLFRAQSFTSLKADLRQVIGKWRFWILQVP